MRVLQSGRQAVIWCFIGWLVAGMAHAHPFSVAVRRAELNSGGGGFYLKADIDYRLSLKATEALYNGIPLFWDIRVRILEPRKLLWDKTIAEQELRFRIQYHALLNMYRIRNEDSGMVYNFSTLAAALDRMSSIRGVPFFSGLELDPGHSYLAAIKVDFDRESLPLPLRPIAYLNPQWYLSSAWYVWPLTK
ncbi:MAG: DUF4390 domain-containing protein [Gammaproteobacteria bacterium]